MAAARRAASTLAMAYGGGVLSGLLTREPSSGFCHTEF
jgi:hypothetical protein